MRVGYLKDNRLLPHGFDKATAMKDIAVTGGGGGRSGVHRQRGSTVRYVVSTGECVGAVQGGGGALVSSR